LTLELSSVKKQIIKKRRSKMQTNKKINPAGEAFDIANSINKVSRTGHLYGRLFSLQEMEIHILCEIKKVKEQIEREDKNE
jgi:hypothetical protein|tara:strand:- start:208 stop:450 length:243 start_codon:yes stop_codon:yes gene_type:complete